MTRELRKLTPLLLLMALGALAGCLPEGDDGESGGVWNPDASLGDISVGDALGDRTWPPEIVEESVTVVVGAGGGTWEVFPDELSFTLPAGVYEEDTALTVSRSIVSVGGDSWVGYIWGDHGYPVIDPVGSVEVIAPPEWIPDGPGPPESLGLYLVRAGALDALGASEVTLARDRVILTGELVELGTVVIAAPGT